MFAENKVALVTGGASGLGLEYALELLKNNLRAVTLADVDSAKGEAAVVQITKDFGPNKALFVKTDVTDKKQLENAFKQTVDKFGNLDILINNAGVMNDAIWEKEIAINLNGTIYGCLLAMEEYLPKYKSGNEGVVVNISSVAGLQDMSFLPVYSATKHAVIGLSRSFGTPDQYETTKVRVLTICPGATDTGLTIDMPNKTLNERHKLFLAKLEDDFIMQSPNAMRKCLTKALEDGRNGSIWVGEADEVFEIEYPTRQQMKKK